MVLVMVVAVDDPGKSRKEIFPGKTKFIKIFLKMCVFFFFKFVPGTIMCILVLTCRIV